jgi:Etoposide-induced protein 2.4 (EI24)
MNLLFDSFWRAVLYCWHPRLIVISLLPLFLLMVLGVGLGYFFWSDAVNIVRLWLESSGIFNSLLNLLTRVGMHSFRTAAAPLLLIALTTPLLIVLVMTVVALLMTPAIVSYIAGRRFTSLVRSGDSTLWRSALWSLGTSLIALFLLLVSIPLWIVPPLILILPPLIWGWLSYRVMSFDALAIHASSEERREILKRHRCSLLIIGIVTGYLGAMPSLLWAMGALSAVFAVILLPIALWFYTVIFAFSSLWFTHFCLAALVQHRALTASSDPVSTITIPAASASDTVQEITHVTSIH